MPNRVPKSHELRGKLLLLRTTEESDYSGLKALLNHETTMEALKPFFKIDIWTDENIRGRYESFKRQQEAGTAITFTVRNSITNEIVGDAGFKNIDVKRGTAEFGIILHQSTWGTGFSKECHLLCLSYAFADLGLKTICFETDEHNLRMQGFFKKVGIPFKKKTEENYLYYELTREEWPFVKSRLKV